MHAATEFWFGNVQGWRTDRGRIYVTYGKPDRIEKSSSGETRTYNYLSEHGNNVSFVFVNSSGTRDFRLQQKP
jgi:GWxTD domain-containing protein